MGVKCFEDPAVAGYAAALCDDGTIPGKTQPGEILDEPVNKLRTATRYVQIVIAQQQGPIRGAGALPRNMKRLNMTDMQVTCGGRGQSSAIPSRIEGSGSGREGIWGSLHLQTGCGLRLDLRGRAASRFPVDHAKPALCLLFLQRIAR